MDLLPGKNRRKLFGRFCLWFVLAAGAWAIIGCSRQARYEVLTFFFTGVPPLEESQGSTVPSLEAKGPAEAGAEPAEPGQEEEKEEEVAARYKHAPFEAGDCDSCHNPERANRLYNEGEGLCFRCHEDFSQTLPWVHGPVAVGYCKACHEPHESMNKFLLISKSQDICFRCHLNVDVSTASYHEAVGPKTCLDCHSPHGSADRWLLQGAG
jgi:predicted CXXCH cytochrome family protein